MFLRSIAFLTRLAFSACDIGFFQKFYFFFLLSRAGILYNRN
ncbi:hypothetical protein HMPREF1145_0907 [Oribacterium parvum ACB8]|nr:hypothetical protein HMPREF1145_0907 [Oribacterium parvum ACB8]